MSAGWWTGYGRRLFPEVAGILPSTQFSLGGETSQAGMEDFLVKFRLYREQKCKAGAAGLDTASGIVLGIA